MNVESMTNTSHLVGRSHHNPPTLRVLIEQAIARGWSDERICEYHDVTLKRVLETRRALDDLANEDAFMPTDRTVRRGHCRRGHEMTEENTYQRPNGNRECRACKKARNTKRRAA